MVFYAALDLISQPYRYRHTLDRITVTGFLRSRFYRTPAIGEQFRDLMLKGVAVPAHEASVMTMRNVMRYWLRYALPMHRVLNTDLDSGFIAPFAERLKARGVSIVLERRLRRLTIAGDRVVAVEYADGPEDAVENLVIALPMEAARTLIDDEVFSVDPKLTRLHHLTARPMAALHIHFTRRLPDIPKNHVNLLQSQSTRHAIREPRQLSNESSLPRNLESTMVYPIWPTLADRPGYARFLCLTVTQMHLLLSQRVDECISLRNVKQL